MSGFRLEKVTFVRILRDMTFIEILLFVCSRGHEGTEAGTEGVRAEPQPEKIYQEGTNPSTWLRAGTRRKRGEYCPRRFRRLKTGGARVHAGGSSRRQKSESTDE